jgi:hypothetical protein
MKGEWRISVIIAETVTVIHTRGQKHKNAENEILDFELFWKLEFQYDSFGKELEHVLFSIEYLRFPNKKPSDNSHMEIVSLLSEFGYPPKEIRVVNKQ